MRLLLLSSKMQEFKEGGYFGFAIAIVICIVVLIAKRKRTKPRL